MAQEDVNAEVVRAKRFELVDEDDEVRALIATGPDGGASLEFVTDDETSRASIGVNRSGTAVIALRDETGRVRVRVAVEASGSPATFNLRDESDRVRAQMLLHDDAVGVTLSNTTGEPSAFIQILADGYAEVGVRNEASGMVNSLTNG